MQTDVQLPQLAAGVTAARLTAWLKRDGESVQAGQPIVEFETDKTNVEIEAPVSGILTDIRFPAGADVPVGAVVAVIVPASAATEAIASTVSGVSTTAPRRASVERTPEVPFSVAAVRPALSTVSNDRVRATPLAAMMAKTAGLDLSTVRPTGSDERVTKADIDAVLQTSPHRQAIKQPEPITALELPIAAGSSHDVVMPAMRRRTASRLQDAKRSIPHFYLQTECRVDALLALRQELNTKLTDLKISVTDFVVFAAAQALIRVPQANAMWNEDSVRVFDDIDISVAVNTPKGLITPIIRRAQTKTLTALARELKELADLARTGSLKPGQYQGGTVTISNLGMFRVTSIVPILNPPQACILGIGTIERKPVMAGDTITAGSVMTVTLSADHRVIDGATGAELLGELRRLLEEPLVLALRA